MGLYLRQSTEVTEKIGPFLDKTDGVTEETGLAGNGTELTKNGAAFGAGPVLGTHDAEGWYPVTLTTTHTNTVGTLKIKSHDSATHLPVWHEWQVLEEAIYDALFAASANAWSGAAGSSIGVANMTQIGGDAQSATDLKDFADAGYDPSTNKVQGVVLVDTLTTYTGNTPQTGDAFARLGAPAGASHAVDIAAVKAETAAIVADTNELQTDWANGGRLDVLLDAARDNTNYPDGYVYIDDSLGQSGTTVGVNGTARNPVASWADANTIAVARGRKAVKAAPGGGIDIPSGTFDNYNIDLSGGSLILDDAVALTSTQIFSSAKTARVYETSVSNKIVIGQACFLDNLFINGLSVGHAQVYITRCGFYGDVLLPAISATKTPQFLDCYNAKDDGSAVDFNFTSGGEANLQGWYGDLSVSNMPAASTLVCHGYGKLTIAASCTGGTIKHGSHVEINDLASGAVTTELISEPGPLSTAGNLAVADAMLDRSAASHTTNSTLGAIINDLEDGGRSDLLIDQLVADNPNRPTRGVQLDNLVFTMVDETDFNTPETGVTVTATISKDGGAFAACTNSVSEISAGFYKITLTATEMTADSIALKFTGTGCAQRNFAFRTQPT